MTPTPRTERRGEREEHPAPSPPDGRLTSAEKRDAAPSPTAEGSGTEQTSPPSVADLLAARAPEAVAFLFAVMSDAEVKTELRIKAAESILDRACGKTGAAARQGAVAEVRFCGELEEWSE